MTASGIQQLVAGYLSPEDIEAIGNLDVEAYWSIGVAGPATPGLLRKVASRGVAQVADFVHELGVAGPLSPDDLDELLDLDFDRVRSAVVASGERGADATKLMGLARATAARG